MPSSGMTILMGFPPAKDGVGHSLYAPVFTAGYTAHVWKKFHISGWYPARTTSPSMML